jgi:hypothetical protein
MGRPAVNLTGRLHPENMAVRGINISLRVIELRNKKGTYSAVFKAVQGKLLCFKFNMDTCHHFYNEFTSQKIFFSWA